MAISPQSEFDKEVQWRRDLREMFRSTINHWKRLVGGSVLAAIIASAGILGFSVPKSIAGIIAVSSVMVYACFMAWRDKAREVEALNASHTDNVNNVVSAKSIEIQAKETEIKKLQIQLDDRANRRANRETLGMMLLELQSRKRQVLKINPLSYDGDAKIEQEKEIALLTNKIIEFLGNNIGAGEAGMFTSMADAQYTPTRSAGYAHEIARNEHILILDILDQREKKLIKILESYQI